MRTLRNHSPLLEVPQGRPNLAQEALLRQNIQRQLPSLEVPQIRLKSELTSGKCVICGSQAPHSSRSTGHTMNSKTPLMRSAALLIAASSPAGAAATPASQPAHSALSKVTTMKSLLVYVGGYSRGESKGLYCFKLDLASGILTSLGEEPQSRNPSFLALSPDGRFLYAANEISNYNVERAGSVSAYAIDRATGALTFLNRQSSKGADPCHLVVDAGQKAVLVANYSGGSVAALPIGPDGKLGEATSFIQHHGSSVDTHRQEAPHAHSINMDPANRFALAADLGLDKILTYRFDPASRTLQPADPPCSTIAPGSGPRHLAFHPNGRIAYVINEMTSTITCCSYNPDNGSLAEFQTISTLPEDFSGKSTAAEVQVAPNGRFLYGSNRGHDSIASFKIDPDNGHLSSTGFQPSGGKTPRGFCVDTTGQYLLAANQDSNNIVVFKINQETGQLTPTGQTVEIPAPVCIKMLSMLEGD